MIELKKDKNYPLERVLNRMLKKEKIVMMPNHRPPVPPHSTGFIKVNGSHLYYEETGSGHPLVMVQGRNFLDHRIWDEQFAVFARTYHVIRYDGRGFGKSSPSTEPYTQIHDLFQVLQALNIEHTYILDLGGSIALDFVHRYPSYVEALLIVSPSISPYHSSDEALAALPQILKPFAPTVNALQQHDTSRAVEAILQIFHLSPSLSTASSQHIRTMVSDNLQRLFQPSRPPDVDTNAFDTRDQWLPHIQAPTLLLVGDQAAAEIQTSAAALEACLSNVQRRDIAQSHFLLNIEQPQQFHQAVLAFLQTIQ